jgi:two-component system KDP operon response regulator KdpE
LGTFAVVIIFAPASLLRGRLLAAHLREHTPAPLLLIAPDEPPHEAYRALQDAADVLLPPGTDPALIAGHIAALVRRSSQPKLRNAPEGQAAPTEPPDVFRDAILVIDLAHHTVRVDGRTVHLTPTEFRFLALLVRNAGQLLTYQYLLHHIWGWEATEHRVVHTFAAQIRAKLGARGARYIVNEYGTGYRFVALAQES